MGPFTVCVWVADPCIICFVVHLLNKRFVLNYIVLIAGLLKKGVTFPRKRMEVETSRSEKALQGVHQILN